MDPKHEVRDDNGECGAASRFPPGVRNSGRTLSSPNRGLRSVDVFFAEIGADHFGIALDLGRRAVGDDAALVQAHDAVGDAHHHLHVVLDQQHGDAAARGSAASMLMKLAVSTGFMPDTGSSSSSSFGRAASAIATSSRRSSP